MKKLILLLVLSLLGFIPLKSLAQLNVNVNIGSQPLWGPVGYEHVDYYYLPDIDSYYYVPQRQFIYLNAGNWVFGTALPSRYSGYNLYNGYKVVINSPQPYLHYKEHKIKYAGFKGRTGQPVLSKRKNSKNYEIKGSPNQGKKGGDKHYGSNGNGKIKSSRANIGKGNSNGHGNGKGKH
jgi:hypothetical protein